MSDVQVCPKHDVKKVNGVCWCCEQASKPKSEPSKRVPVATGGK
jgi:hypothetical protein